MQKRAVRLPIAALVAILLAGAAGADPLGPFVQNVTTDGATICLRLDREEAIDITVWKPGGEVMGIAATPARKHEVRVTGLAPDTAYRYRVRAGRVDVEAELHTAPPADTTREVALVVFGDSGSGLPMQTRVARSLDRTRFELALHTGDLVYPEGELSDYPARVFEPYGAWMRARPFYPSIGNHDAETRRAGPLLDVFALPGSEAGGERFYRVDWGPVRAIAIDTETSDLKEGSPQHRFIVESLEGAEDRWTIVYGHRPLFTTGRHEEEKGLRYLARALTRAGADLVIAGHNHIYERLEPFEGSGPPYAVTGGGGAILYPSLLGRNRSATRSVVFEARHHFVKIVATRERLQLRAIDTRGRIFDTLTLTR